MLINYSPTFRYSLGYRIEYFKAKEYSVHALNYNHINVFDVQKKISYRYQAKIEFIIRIPIYYRPNWSFYEINSKNFT